MKIIVLMTLVLVPACWSAPPTEMEADEAITRTTEQAPVENVKPPAVTNVEPKPRPDWLTDTPIEPHRPNYPAAVRALERRFAQLNVPGPAAERPAIRRTAQEFSISEKELSEAYMCKELRNVSGCAKYGF